MQETLKKYPETVESLRKHHVIVMFLQYFLYKVTNIIVKPFNLFSHFFHNISAGIVETCTRCIDSQNALVYLKPPYPATCSCPVAELWRAKNNTISVLKSATLHQMASEHLHKEGNIILHLLIYKSPLKWGHSSGNKNWTTRQP